MAISEQVRERNKTLIGALIANRRSELDLTQPGLGKLLGKDGYSYVSAIEQGHMTLPVEAWIPIASALRLDVDEFVLHCWKSLHPDIYAAVTNDVKDSVFLEWMKKSTPPRNIPKIVRAFQQK